MVDEPLVDADAKVEDEPLKDENEEAVCEREFFPDSVADAVLLLELDGV